MPRPNDSPAPSGARIAGFSIAQKLTALVVGLVIASTAVVAVLSVGDFRTELTAQQLHLLGRDSQALALRLTGHINELRSQALYLANTPPISGIARAANAEGIDPRDGSTQAQWIERLEILFGAMLRIAPDVNSARFIAADGQELVRVDRDSGVARAVRGAQLQRLADTAFFLDALSRTPGSVRLSGIALQRDAGVIAEPHTPLLRATVTVPDEAGAKFGVVALSQDMRPLFKQLESASGTSQQVYLTNAEGEYLLHPDASRAFAFERGSSDRIQGEFEGLAEQFEQIGGNEFARFFRHGGQDDSLSLTRVALNAQGGQTHLIVGLAQDPTHLIALAERLARKVFVVAGIVALLALGAGLWIARSISYPLRQLVDATTHYGSGLHRNVLPNATGGEIGSLVRSYQQMMDRIREDTIRMEAEIEVRERAETQLQNSVIAREMFHDITGDEDLRFEEKARRLLRLGVETLGLTEGGLLEQRNGRLELLYDYGAIEETDGRTMQLALQVCERRHLIAMESVQERDADDQRDLDRQAGCFIGVPVFVSGDLLGPLVFAAPGIRSRTFSRNESSLILSMSQWFGNELQRQKVDRALRRSEFQQRAILDNMLDGLVTIDELGTVQSFNRAAAVMFDYSPDEVIGRNVKMLMPEPYHSEHDGYLSNYMAGGAPKIIGTGREVVAQRKDGSVFPIDLAVTEVAIGRGRSFVGVVRDISERKETEERMRLQGTALETAANAVVITEANGSIVWVNEAFSRYTGYGRDEVIGLNPKILKSGHHGHEFYKRLWETLLAGDVWHGEIVNRRKDGTFYTEEQTITPVKNETGRITHYVAIKQDVTERRRLERMKNEFVSTVSHELRTPLTSIRGSLGLLLGGGMGELSAQVKGLVEIACNNSERLVRLINDILDIEKIESGKMSFQLRPLELAPLVEDAVAANQGFADAHQVTIEVQNKFGEARILADADRLTQVITNLISNAAKFSSDGGCVGVKVSPVDRGVRIAVSDQGPGIPEEFQGRVFGKFAQADASDTRQCGGTGLGLSISKAIVDKLGGLIGFETEVGQGTTFFVELPLWITSELADTTYTGGQPLVLICEDDPDVATLLQILLDKHGVSADVAYSAEEAWQKLASRDYAAMTLDLMLPGQDGLSFLHQLRQEDRTGDLPVVVVSAIADQAAGSLEGDALTVVDWLEKPIDDTRLTQAILLALHRAEVKNTHPRILHVEDDRDVAQVVSAILSDTATVILAETLAEAKERLASEELHLIILDVGLPDGSGLSLLPLITERQPPVPVVIFSARDVDQSVAKGVAATLIKSRTSNQRLINTIKQTILEGSQRQGTAEEDADHG